MVMLIVCPSCATSYVIDPISLGTAIRTVRCTRCKSAWIAGDQKAQVDVIGIIAGLIAKAESHGVRTNAPDKHQSAPPSLQLPSVNNNTCSFVDHRRASSRRYSGIALTGAALIAGVVFTFLDSRINYASVPEIFKVTLRGSLGGNERFGVPVKSDRLLPTKKANASRQFNGVSRALRVGDNEVMIVRPLVRIADSLSLTASTLSADIAAYSAQELPFEPESSSALSETPTLKPDTEVAVVMRDMLPLLPQLNIVSTVADDEVIKRVRETCNWMENTANHLQVAADVTGVRLARAEVTSNSGSYANRATRNVLDNVTLLVKTVNQATSGNRWNERVIAVRKGDDVSSMLRELGATANEINSIITVLGPHGQSGGITEAQNLRVLLAPTADGAQLKPVRIIVASGPSVEAAVALSDMGKYVPVDLRNIYVNDAENGEGRSAENEPSGVSVYQSVLETARRNQIPNSIVKDLFRIYSNNVDFQRDVQPGDAFEVLFASEEASASDNRNKVLYTALTIGGKTKKFYRYQSPDENASNYYDENGKSAKKLVVRKPVTAGIVRSGFGPRRDPILGYTRMHTGVDISVPTGTPIYASGNGIVELIGWESGYGKYIRIRHTARYETAYGHMTAYARNIRVGTRVRQGQVIGFVGSTGFSTGPHLHYEILVDGRFVDPMQVELPRARVLVGPMLTSFEREREEIDNHNNDMASKPSLVASTQPLAR